MNRPESLDSSNARPRTRDKTEFIITAFDPGIVWDEFGARSDVVVSQACIYILFQSTNIHSAIHVSFSTCRHP